METTLTTPFGTMTPQEQEIAKKDLKEIMNFILRAEERLDIEAYFYPLLDSPDFIYIGPDGSRLNYRGYHKKLAEEAVSILNEKFTTTKEEFIFLPENHAIYLWLGKSEFTLKSGLLCKYDQHACTSVFKKIENQWKIFYIHESSVLTFTEEKY